MAITDPRDIPGLLIWYSAEAETGYADGDQMTGWTDLSGNGNHAGAAAIGGSGRTPRWHSSGGAAGGPSVRFDEGYFTPPDVMTGATAGEAMASIYSDGGTSTSLWTWGAIGGGNYSNEYPSQFFGGNIADSFGLANSQRQTFLPVDTITGAWSRYNVYSAPGDWVARVNGTVRHTYTTGTVAWHTVPVIGHTTSSGGITGIEFDGRWACFLLYDRKLTTTERTDLDAWLAANPSGGTAGGAAANTLDTVAAAATSSIQVGAASETATLGVAAAAATSALTLDNAFHTDITNANNVRRRSMRCGVNITYPVAPVPAGVSEAELRDAILAYPQPTMVNGRPT